VFNLDARRFSFDLPLRLVSEYILQKYKLRKKKRKTGPAL
jgi:hypothetical protein